VILVESEQSLTHWYEDGESVVSHMYARQGLSENLFSIHDSQRCGPPRATSEPKLLQVCLGG
jgi:hypothetical protein